MNSLNQYLIFILTLFTNSLFSWTASVHMIIAHGAEERLEPKVKEKVNNLLSNLYFTPARTFMESAAYPDYIRREGLLMFNQWHTSWLPYDPDHILSPEKIAQMVKQEESNDAIYAITEGIRILKDPTASPFAKAWMLTFVIHCTGELHQPLHTITLFNHDFPEGDHRGSAFKILYHSETQSLHSFWDTAAGLYPKLTPEPLTKRNKQLLVSYSDALMHENPTEPKAAAILDPYQWREESYQLAKRYAYEGIAPHTEVSEAYIERTREICKKQIALATYRLANLLNGVFKDE